VLEEVGPGPEVDLDEEAGLEVGGLGRGDEDLGHGGGLLMEDATGGY